MKISELIASTKRVPNRNTFADKPFGEIYVANKRTELNNKNNILTVTMLIKGITDKIDGRPVAAHRVRIRISNITAETYSFDDIVSMVREKNPKYADTNEYKDKDVIQIALDGNRDEGGNVFFPDKTLFKNDPAGYSLIDNKISDKSEIKVWCSCSDYFWTFQYYNVDNDVDIIGRKKKYTPVSKAGKLARKTDSPLRNPNKDPGMCKHLMLLLSMLMNEEVVEAKSNSSTSLLNHYTLNMNRFQKLDRITERQYNNLMAKYERDYKKKREYRKKKTQPGSFWRKHVRGKK